MWNNKIDTFILFGKSNRFYFTQFDASFGCVILTENHKLFITDSRYEREARDSVLDFDIVTVSNGNLYDIITKECSKLKSKVIGYEDKELSVNDFKSLKTALPSMTFKPSSKIIDELRAVKTDNEIANIASAQNIAQKALSKVIPLIKPGITEKELAAELNYNIVISGGDKPSFSTIVAFGESSACPHHKPTAIKLDKNDVILIDFGVKYNGYCSDMTRTFSLGNPNTQLIEIHEIVLEAQNYALKNLSAGMTGHEVDTLSREYIIANGYGNEFGHGLGHGVGIDIHEYPRLGVNADNVLKENMVVTVEPGVYINGLGGIRIEDLVVIKKEGILNLTNFNKNMNI